uniref:Uncharacterized protein n=1 Tax=Fagus sylvatica TaxID=28930 RepID=A0A2N9H328_FAGSY
MNRFRRHYGVPDDVHLEYRFWEDALTGEPGDLILPLVAVIEGGVRFPIDPLLADFLDFFSLPDTNKEMTDDFLLVRGNWYFPGHRCPTVDGRPEEKKKQVQPHLTNPVALKTVYDSECRQVKNLVEALANPANQSPPAHDIREMASINLKKLLPPSRPQAETSDPILPLERKRKRKGPSKGEASHKEAPVAPEAVQAQVILPGVDTLPSADETDVEMVGPFVPGTSFASSAELAPVWVPSLETAGERVRTDATVLRTGESGSNTASALCKVARLPGDMTVWRQSTNQEVVNNLHRGLMMGSLELGDRFQRQAAELENALKAATRSFDFRNEAERLMREVEAYKDQVRIAVLKKEEAVLKMEDTKDLLRNALEANSKAEEKFKALEADVMAREKAAFDWGQVEAQNIMTKQLPDMYNEAFQQGWKALYSWPESDDMPELPPQENLPYPEAPIGVPEEELPEPLPEFNEEAGPSTV